MAEYGRSMGQGNASDLHHSPQLPFAGGPLVACRICDAVFSSSQALINHIGSHLADDGIAASRRQHQRNPTCRLPLGSPFPPPPRAGQLFFPNRFLPHNSLGSDVELAIAWPHQLPPFARNVVTDMPQYPPPISQSTSNWSAAEEPASDCTKPYINQLEKCIPKLPDAVEEDDSCQLYYNQLDLTLKL